MGKGLTVAALAAWCRRQPQGLLVAIWDGQGPKPIDPEAIELVPRMGERDQSFQAHIASVTREQLDALAVDEDPAPETAPEPVAEAKKRGRKPATLS